MAVGYQITQNGINANAGRLAVRLEQLASDTLRFSTELSGLSLTTVGFTSGDATAMSAAVLQMTGIATIYNGTTFTSAHNYDAGIAPLRGLGAPG